MDVQLSTNNNFVALQDHVDEDSDIEVIYEYKKPQQELVLLDSEEDEDEDAENEVETKKSVDQSNPKKRKFDEVNEADDDITTETNELAKNEDFIGFGFLSTDEEESEGEESEMMVTVVLQTPNTRGLKIMIILLKKRLPIGLPWKYEILSTISPHLVMKSLREIK